MEARGYVVERKCAGERCLNGLSRFDIADRGTGDLWEIKRYSIHGMTLGEIALDAYTDGTGFQRGGDLPGLKVGETTTARGERNWYNYKNLGNGLIVYSPDESRIRLKIPYPWPLPAPKKDPYGDPRY